MVLLLIKGEIMCSKNRERVEYPPRKVDHAVTVEEIEKDRTENIENDPKKD